ncbi:hypothetical protein BN2537_4047 [Streptomyces venezuelae]|nr:hypothetical protein BN2537_4047 [Streptomyces venezuelae]
MSMSADTGVWFMYFMASSLQGHSPAVQSASIPVMSVPIHGH